MVEIVFFLALKFRKALERASLAGEFNDEKSVGHFPIAWCGVASSLLAKYLFEHGIYTYEVSGTNYDDYQSHMWLRLLNGDIVDITGDQFKDRAIYNNYDKEVFVGPIDDFHLLFEVCEDRDVYEYKDCTLIRINNRYPYDEKYKIIIDYL